MKQTLKIIHCAALAALCFTAAPLWAQTEPAQHSVVELNTIEQSQDACRLTFTVQSPSGLAGLETQTVLFNTSGAVQTFTLFGFGEVPANGLRVRQFDVPSTQCKDIGMILFNEVTLCTSVDGNACATAPKFISRIDNIEVQQ